MSKVIKESDIRKIIRKELIREADENQARLDDKLDIAFKQLNIDVEGKSSSLIKVVKQMTHLILIAIDKNAFQNISGEGGKSIMQISKDLSESISSLDEKQRNRVVEAVYKLNSVIRQNQKSPRKENK